MRLANRRLNWTILTALTALLLLPLTMRALADVPPEDIAKIEAALPAAATVAPAAPRKVLIFSLCKGFRHGAIPHGIEALTRLGAKTGAYEAVVSDDVAMFQADNLDQFDAIIFNNTTGTLFEDEALRKSLMDFIKGGKGVVGIHAATDCFYDWPQFGAMMGGYFDGHPWNEQVTIKLDEPDHPINAAFDGKPLVVADEIYQFKAPYSRDELRVLLSLDALGTDMSKNGMKREDGDFAVSWVRSWADGRVFYCSLGHRNDIFWNPAVLRHYLDGIQFAIGDLDADAAPSAVVAADELDGAFAEVASYSFGDSRMPLTIIANHVREALADPDDRSAIVERLLALLESADSTTDCRAFVCRELALIGGDESVPALAAMLGDAELSHMARYALQRIPGDAAGAALREALAELEGELLIGVINSLGERREAEAVSAMAAVAADAEGQTYAAVLQAAAKIGGPEGITLLATQYARARFNDMPERIAAIRPALITCADGLMGTAEHEAAVRIYRQLYDDEACPEHIRIAALVGLARAEPLQTAPVLAELLKGEDEGWRTIAAGQVVTMSGEGVTEALAAQLVTLDPGSQIVLIEALADRGDRAAAPAVMAATEAGELEVSDAAIRALGKLGGPSCISLLAAHAADGSDAARDSLHRLRGPDIDDAIVASMDDASADVRTELALALGARRASAEIPALLDVAASDDETTVRLAALHSLALLAGEDEIEPLVQLLVQAPSAEDRDAAVEAVAAACSRMDDVDRRARPVVGEMREADAETKCALLGVMGRIGGETALKAVRTALRSGEKKVADAALAALAAWPDAGAADDLLAVAQETSEPSVRERAFAGYLRGVGLTADRGSAEIVAMYEKAFEIVANDEEARLVLEGLSTVAHPAALVLAERYVGKTEIAHDAAAAVFAIARALGEEHETEALDAVEFVLHALPDDDDLRAKAGEAINHLQHNEDFITTWRFAGPYKQDNAGASALFDVAFPPEQFDEATDDIAWREIPDAAFSEPGVYDLTKVEQAGDCCCYLIATITSESAQEARLEMGSDDGLKVWLNGEVVHANNAARGLTVGQDVCTVSLNAGENTLLMKITQGGGGWQACCRIRGVDGFALQGVEIVEP